MCSAGPVATSPQALKDLVVVMPVYNEAALVAGVVRSWHEVLTAAGLDFEFLVLDDGSTDATPTVLAQVEALPNVDVTTKANEGHGPTIFGGYQRAVTRGTWVLQIDSDDEVQADAFARLWEAREDHDAVLGRRAGREQSASRKVLSTAARWTVRAAFGRGLRDVNTPYRLMKATRLQRALAQLSGAEFAPNVAIAGLLLRDGASVLEVDVPFVPRAAGEAFFVGPKMLRIAARAFVQTLRASRGRGRRG